MIYDPFPRHLPSRTDARLQEHFTKKPLKSDRPSMLKSLFQDTKHSNTVRLGSALNHHIVSGALWPPSISSGRSALLHHQFGAETGMMLMKMMMAGVVSGDGVDADSSKALTFKKN